MTNNTDGKDYFQCYVDSWTALKFKDPVKTITHEDGKVENEIAINVINNVIDDMIQFSKECLDKFDHYVTAIEVSKGGDKIKPRIHFQTIIVNQFANRQTATKKVTNFAKHKALDGKLKQFGCIKGKMEKPLEDSIKYVLKDQTIGNGRYLFKGFDEEYINGLIGKWEDPEEFKFKHQKKSELCDNCKGPIPKTYTQKLANDCLEFFKFKEPTKHAIVEYVMNKVMTDKARLPVNTVVEISRAICVKLQIIDSKDLIEKYCLLL